MVQVLGPYTYMGDPDEASSPWFLAPFGGMNQQIEDLSLSIYPYPFLSPSHLYLSLFSFSNLAF